MKIFLHSVNLGVNLKHTIKFINPTKYIYGEYSIVYSYQECTYLIMDVIHVILVFMVRVFKRIVNHVLLYV
jgi:hypothetical protein